MLFHGWWHLAHKANKRLRNCTEKAYVLPSLPRNWGALRQWKPASNSKLLLRVRNDNCKAKSVGVQCFWTLIKAMSHRLLFIVGMQMRCLSHPHHLCCTFDGDCGEIHRRVVKTSPGWHLWRNFNFLARPWVRTGRCKHLTWHLFYYLQMDRVLEVKHMMHLLFKWWNPQEGWF